MDALIFYVIVLIVIAADQLTKWWVRTHLEMGRESTVFMGLVHLFRVENTGASAKLFQGHGKWLIIVTALLVAFVLYSRSKGKYKARWTAVGTGLFIGGAVGNAIDRVFFDGVTDFIKASANSIMNMADICLYAGLLVILLDRFVAYRRRRAQPEGASHFRSKEV